MPNTNLPFHFINSFVVLGVVFKKTTCSKRLLKLYKLNHGFQFMDAKLYWSYKVGNTRKKRVTMCT